MTRPLENRRCVRRPSDKETLVSASGFDVPERFCLEIMRLFFSNFALEGTRNWIRAFEHAYRVFGEDVGPVIASRLLQVLCSMRTSRVSVFTFSAPDCPGCSRILTEHERRLMAALVATRRGRAENAALHLMLLCEGNQTGTVLKNLQKLVQVLPEKENVAP